jgi:thiol-disulfide isomerase/thioredoxin
MNKNQKILLAIIGILIIVSVVIGFLAFKKEKNNTETETNKFKEEYESLNGVVNDDGYTYPTVNVDVDNPMVYVTEEEVLDILKDKTGVIYFGFPTCPWCRNAVPSLISAAESVGLSKIYYLNILDIRDSLSVNDSGEIVVEKEGTKNYKKILKKLDKILDDYYVTDALGNKVNTNEKRLYVPTVVVVKDGEIVDYHMDTVASHIEAGNGYAELTKDQREELFDIYTNMFLKIANSSCGDESGC